MSTYDRKLELERKKAKLAALRDSKQKRDKVKFGLVSDGSQDSLPDLTPGHGLHIDTDELLRNLGLTLNENGTADQILHSKSSSDLPNHNKSDSPRRVRKLGFSNLNEISVPPKDSISYSKEIQTVEPSIPIQLPNVTQVESPKEVMGSPRFIAHLEWDDEFSTVLPFDDSSLGVALDETRATGDTQRTPIIAPDEASNRARDRREMERSIKVLSMTEEQRMRMMQTEEFQSFFDRASRLIERALDNPEDDIFVDYSGADREDVNASERHQLLRFGRDFFDDRWSRRRTITAIDWSSIFPELLLAAYSPGEDAPHDPDGVCLIWNLKYQKATPEYIFHCQSRVTSATLSPFHPNLIVGGTYSGQIVLWDNRCTKRTPVQRTLLSATAHTHPINAVMIAGTQNAHNLISVSSDGKLCSWSLDMLGQPQQSMELTYRQTRTVAATSMSFFNEDVNNFLVGSEDGRVYMGSRHGNQAGITEMFEAHQAPVTSVSTHTTVGPVDFSSLFLSTSFDWTVKLWSVKDSRPICSFDESSDFVMDCDWSPIHPSIFATVDCTGRLDLWNLNDDTEVPSARTTVDGQFALNKCRFHSSGLHVAAGDETGRIHIYDLNESMVSPRPDEWAMFAHTIEELHQLNVEPAERDIDRGSVLIPTR
ncbi:unnamed protein product [Calicophoron daubneyi]|uniref:Cytoplasmic dynein 1 intermediate chain 2 n=1 Tax=Calicophoron daubneyi TaxID=300641 RepID=A0AAV2T410_CALDB